MPLEQDALDAMTHEDKVRDCCNISRYPALRYTELSKHYRVAVETIKVWVKEGRKWGLKTKVDLYGNRQPDEPSTEEMLWRFKNQTVKEILARFDHDLLLTSLRELELMTVAPRELMEKLIGEDYSVETTKKKTVDVDSDILYRPYSNRKMVMIQGSEIELDFRDDDELRFITDIVTSINRRYIIEGSDWRMVLPIINLYLDQHRATLRSSDPTSKDLKDRAEAVKSIGSLINSLGFEEKRGESAAQRYLSAARSAQQYMEERGWRENVACPECGTMIALYFCIYRSCIELINLARQGWEERIVTTDQFRVMKEEFRKILDFVREHPYLQKQLRDLGMAWSKPVVDWAVSFQARHPEVQQAYMALGMSAEDAEEMFWEEMASLLGNIFEVGPVCFDRNLPYSPINRVMEDETGRLSVVTPED